jgi:hypothetical protein
VKSGDKEPDHKKDAVLVGVTLSNTIITASVSLIAVLATITSIFITNYVLTVTFYIFVFLAFFALIASIFTGGKGIDKIRKEGFENNWQIEYTKSIFNKQAIFCLFGILFVFLTLIIGLNSTSKETKAKELEEKIRLLEDDFNRIKKVLQNNDT